MDEEHRAFWVGNLDNECILEVNKSLDLSFIYGENQDEQIQTKLSNWEEVRYLFQLYFSEDGVNLKNTIKLKQFTYTRL